MSSKIKPAYGSVKIEERIKVFSIKEGIAILSGKKKNKYSLDLTKDRYKCFLNKGYQCYMCKVKASYFALEKVSSSSYDGYAINLYAKKENGKDEYFTKDHLIPKSLGGKNDLSNYDTMCWTCNRKKGSSLL